MILVHSYLGMAGIYTIAFPMCDSLRLAGAPCVARCNVIQGDVVGNLCYVGRIITKGKCTADASINRG